MLFRRRDQVEYRVDGVIKNSLLLSGGNLAITALCLPVVAFCVWANQEDSTGAGLLRWSACASSTARYPTKEPAWNPAWPTLTRSLRDTRGRWSGYTPIPTLRSWGLRAEPDAARTAGARSGGRRNVAGGPGRLPGRRSHRLGAGISDTRTSTMRWVFHGEGCSGCLASGHEPYQTPAFDDARSPSFGRRSSVSKAR